MYQHNGYFFPFQLSFTLISLCTSVLALAVSTNLMKKLTAWQFNNHSFKNVVTSFCISVNPIVVLLCTLHENRPLDVTFGKRAINCRYDGKVIFTGPFLMLGMVMFDGHIHALERYWKGITLYTFTKP